MKIRNILCLVLSFFIICSYCFALVEHGFADALVSSESLYSDFNISDYRDIYLLEVPYENKAGDAISTISSIQLKKIENMVTECFNRKGYNPVWIKDKNDITDEKIPVVGVVPWCVTSQTYSGHFYVSYGSAFSIMKDKEVVQNISAQVTQRYIIGDNDEVCIRLYEKLFSQEIPYSMYAAPIVKYSSSGVLPEVLYAQTQFERKSILLLKSNDLFSTDVYVYEGRSSVIVDLLMTGIVFYPFSGKMSNIYVRNKDNKVIEVNSNNYIEYARIYYPPFLSIAKDYNSVTRYIK